MADLPGVRPDPYRGVDSGNFDTVAELTTAQRLEMADLAASRGEQNHAMRWKSLAVESARRDEIREETKRLEDMSKPKPMPPPGRILDTPGALPWETDSEYRDYATQVAVAQEALKQATKMLDHEGINTHQAELNNAQGRMKEREHAIKESLRASGVWTDMDQRTLDAQRSLNEKSAVVAKQFKG